MIKKGGGNKYEEKILTLYLNLLYKLLLLFFSIRRSTRIMQCWLIWRKIAVFQNVYTRNIKNLMVYTVILNIVFLFFCTLLFAKF